MKATALPQRRGRHRICAAGALAALALPLAACTSGYRDGPDPLTPLVEQTRSAADAAHALAGSPAAEQPDVAQQVGDALDRQAEALRAEVRRQNSPGDNEANPPATQADGLAALRGRLQQQQDRAGQLVVALPRHRAGLVGAVAAGSAQLQQLDPALGADQPSATDEAASQVAPLPKDAVAGAQEALDAEHAAVWVYGLAGAFLPDGFDTAVSGGEAKHTDRRDACERVIGASGATPRVAKPAYVTPEPVTDSASAMRTVATAETDATRAWHGVLERTDDAALRTIAARALSGSAVRETQWRAEADIQPATTPLPGRDASSG